MTRNGVPNILSDSLREPVPMLDAADEELRALTKQEAVLVETLASAHPAEQIRILDTNPLHAVYIDKSETSVDEDAIAAIRDAGFTIVASRFEAPRRMRSDESGEQLAAERAAVEFTGASDGNGHGSTWNPDA